MQTVCILAAGKGTRLGQATQVFNKATLPLGPKAVISHIMAQFSKQDTHFVVALGYLGEQVRDYLSLAHPDAHIDFAMVDNFEGPGSGPGYSLLCCREKLQKPFYMIAVDTLFQYELENALPTENWVGVAHVNEADSAAYCNFTVDARSHVIAISDKQRTRNAAAFIGLMHVYDYKAFWRGLAEADMVSGEHQVSSGIAELIKISKVRAIAMPWQDIGNSEGFLEAGRKFHAFDFSKVDEAIYFAGEQVIKMFANPKLVSDRVAKARIKPSVFPQIGAVKKQMYSYHLVPGETLYQQNDPALFRQLLAFLDRDVWTPVNVSPVEMVKLTQQFYYDKTMGRLKQFAKKIPDFIEPDIINGKKIPRLDALLALVPWDMLYEGTPVFIHGDLQFDNILFDRKSSRFTLIDWRQDFSGRVDAGDLYYDLAKLNGGILLNYDFVKRGYLVYREENEVAVIDFATRFLADDYRALLRAYCKDKGYNWRKVQILTGLIFLNMAPLHTPPFDKALHALARLTLTDIFHG